MFFVSPCITLLRFLIALCLLPIGWFLFTVIPMGPLLLMSLFADQSDPDEVDKSELYCPVVKLRLRPACEKQCKQHCPSVVIRALLDTSSGVSYLSGRVVEKLQLKPSSATIYNRYYWRQHRFADPSTELALTTAVSVIMEALEDASPSADVVPLFVFPGDRIPISQAPPTSSLCELSAVKGALLIDDPDIDLPDSFPEDVESIDLVIGQDLLNRKILEERQQSWSVAPNMVIVSTKFGNILQGGGVNGEAVPRELPDLPDHSMMMLVHQIVRLILWLVLQQKTYFWMEVKRLKSELAKMFKARTGAEVEAQEVALREPEVWQDQQNQNPNPFPVIKTINLPTLCLPVRHPRPLDAPTTFIRVLLDSGAKYSTIATKTVRCLGLLPEPVLPPKVLFDLNGTPYHLYSSVIVRLENPVDPDDHGQLIRLFVDPIDCRVPHDGPRNSMLNEALYRHIELTDGTPESGEIIEAIIGQDLLTSTFLVEPEQVAVMSPPEEQPTSWAFVPTLHGTVVQGVAYEKPPGEENVQDEEG